MMSSKGFRYLVVHTAHPDGVPRPHFLPAGDLSLSVGGAGLGVVDWPGGSLAVLERASVLLRALGGSRAGETWDKAVEHFEQIEQAIADASQGSGAARSSAAAACVAPMPSIGSWSPLSPDDPSVEVVLPGAHGGSKPPA